MVRLNDEAPARYNNVCVEDVQQGEGVCLGYFQDHHLAGRCNVGTSDHIRGERRNSSDTSRFAVMSSS